MALDRRPNPLVRTVQLDRAADLADELCPPVFTPEQRARLVSFAEDAAVAGRDIEIAIVLAAVSIAVGAIDGREMGPS